MSHIDDVTGPSGAPAHESTARPLTGPGRAPAHIGDAGRLERAPAHESAARPLTGPERAPAHFGDAGRLEGAPAHIDARIAELAGRQHGVVTLAQLRAVGLSSRGIQHRVGRGSLHRLYRGVFAVGHVVLTPAGRRLAAVLASGRGAVLSHGSAAAAWGLRPSTGSRHDVTIAGHRRGPVGVRLHCVRRLDPADVGSVDGVPVTSSSRTLIDLAGLLDATRLERAVHEAAVLRLLDMRTLAPMLDAANGRRGTGVLRRLLAESSPGGTRSELEIRFLALCRRHGLPAPRCNVLVAGMEVDVLWRAPRVIVELDGVAVHRTRRAFHADRRRDAALAAAGYVVVRLTWERVTGEDATVAAELRRTLERRTRRAAAHIGDV